MIPQPLTHSLANTLLTLLATPASKAPSKLTDLAALALERAKALGATSAEVEVSTSVGQNVTVRLGEVETIEHNRDKGLSMTVYIGQHTGNASTSDLSPAAIERTVAAALAIAKYTAEDECAGLADASRLAKAPFNDLAIYQPWKLSVADAIAFAKEMEAAAFAVDKRLDNSDGASVSTSESDFIYANSLGFMGGYPTTRHSASATMIASDKNGMQRDYWYAVAREESGLESAAAIGRRAGERTVARLGARKAPSGEFPVLYEATMAAGLIHAYVNAVSGAALRRRASFLMDSMGQQILSPIVSILEDPYLARGLASGPFDNEGVTTARREVVKAGVVAGYFLGSYSARKLGLETTGNAGGAHNLIVTPGALDFAALVKKMHRGFIVTELMGSGVNGVTGDYSRGAAGFWVENGEIAYAVEETTIAGNMKDMLKGIIAIGNDVLALGSISCGSILVDKLSIAGE